jgi:UPF0271 protein
MDVNCDMGEGFGHYRIGAGDDVLLDRITSANIACGWHAGDSAIMDDMVRKCIDRGIAIGAHPGLPDKLAFGRRRWDLSPDEAAQFGLYQVGALDAFARRYGATVEHWKPHGAFYVAIREDPRLAASVAKSLLTAYPELVLYHPGPIEEMTLCREYAECGGRVVGEVYVDTQITPDFAYVVDRHKHGADLDHVRTIVRRWLETGAVLANDDKTEIPIAAKSICVHGDGTNAPEVLDAVREELTAAGLSLGRPSLP